MLLCSIMWGAKCANQGLFLRGVLSTVKCEASEGGTYKKAHTCVNQLGERSVGSATGSLLPFVRKQSHVSIDI